MSKKFPHPPFKFEREDGDLLRYLKRIEIKWLGARARNVIKKLNISCDLGQQRNHLCKLWGLVLTRALKGLKQRDPREWGKDGGADYGSFFNEESLGMGRLKKVFEAFGKFESLMYGARPDRYRDHVAHVFRVWIIGHGLLKTCFGGRLASGTDFDRAIEAVEWECMWAITALCHDLGYCLGELENINQRARESLKFHGLQSAGDLRYVFSPMARPLHDVILRLMSSKPVKAENTKQAEPEDIEQAGAGNGNGDDGGTRFLTHPKQVLPQVRQLIRST